MVADEFALESIGNNILLLSHQIPRKVDDASTIYRSQQSTANKKNDCLYFKGGKKEGKMLFNSLKDELIQFDKPHGSGSK